MGWALRVMLLVVAFAAGCTPASTGGGAGPLPKATASPAAGAQPDGSLQQNVTVTVRNMAFKPASVEIPTGGTVTWRFEDAVAHNSRSDQGSAISWDSGLLRDGATFSLRFDTPGTFEYACTPHPQMRGKVVVR